MGRWNVHERSNKHDIPRPRVERREWVVAPSSMAMGYSAFIAEFPYTPEGREMAENVVSILEREFVAGQAEAQKSARHAIALAAGLDEDALDRLEREEDE